MISRFYSVAKLVRTAQEQYPISFQPYLADFLRTYYNTILSYNPKASDDRTCEQMASFVTRRYHSPYFGITIGNQEEFSAQANISIYIAREPSHKVGQTLTVKVLSFCSLPWT